MQLFPDEQAQTGRLLRQRLHILAGIVPSAGRTTSKNADLQAFIYGGRTDRRHAAKYRAPGEKHNAAVRGARLLFPPPS